MRTVGREQPHHRDQVVDGAIPQVRYERELTVGTVGTLWLGRLTSGSEAGRTVLLRRMSCEDFSPKELDSIKQVAEAYAKVRHPSLMKLLGVIEQDRDLVSVSEHLDGVRLGDLLRHAIDNDKPLPATVAVRVVLDAARATIKAHRLAGELGLYPADRLFVPEGVFVAAFGGTLLTEIGMLSAVARCNKPRTIPDLVVQLAPEELEKALAAKGSPEVFSLGIILWEALANSYLFSRDSLRRATDDLRGLPIVALNRIERCGMPVPDALAELVRIAISRDPAERYPSLEKFVAALEQLPVHFVATEHHVAAALRNQAAELLQAYHVDPSQSSLTLAFSEVPASRFSTRPPPVGGHSWDPPTFNQSSLVSGGVRALNLPKSEITGEAELNTEPVDTFSALPEPRTRTPRHRYALWAGVSLVALTAILAIASIGRYKPLIQPEARRMPIHDMVPSGPTSAPTGEEVPNRPSATAVLDQSPPAHPNAVPDPPVTRAQESSSPIWTGTGEHESLAPANTTKRTGATYRPRQIAPYRPKGI